MTEKSPFALVLLSGGLDSVLAAKVLMEQGVRVEGVGFVTPFFGAEGEKSAKGLGIPFQAVDISDEHFQKVKKPKWGHGGAINPCIDCHALMVSKAWELIKEMGEEKGFVATGEVLGQRPMSQNKDALGLVLKNGGEVVRPLSAKLLPETEMEKKGWVKREELLDISGRGRGRQLELAEKWGIDFFNPPAGGCVLTEKDFGVRVRELLKRWPECDAQTAGLLRWGRVMWFENGLGMVGRDKKENEILGGFLRKGDVGLKMKGISGSFGLVRNFGREVGEDDLEVVKEKIRSCSRGGREAEKVEWEVVEG